MRYPQTPMHPGRILLCEFLQPMGCSRNELATELGWPLERLEQFLGGQISVDLDIAADLARTLGTGSRLWLQLQAMYSADQYDRRQRLAA